jgi:anthranilate/para-aminobenzoate synthase component II
VNLLVIDNYDSFTYNLVQYFGELGATCEVLRNDEATLEEINIEPFDGLVLSPGPCDPDQAGISLAAVNQWAGKKPFWEYALVTNALAKLTVERLYGQIV